MYYINAENMLKAMSKPELVQLTNDEPRATEPDMAVVDEAIRYASDLVDGYLRGRYPLPLKSVPTVLPHCVSTMPPISCTRAASNGRISRRHWRLPTTRL